MGKKVRTRNLGMTGGQVNFSQFSKGSVGGRVAVEQRDVLPARKKFRRQSNSGKARRNEKAARRHDAQERLMYRKPVDHHVLTSKYIHFRLSVSRFTMNLA